MTTALVDVDRPARKRWKGLSMTRSVDLDVEAGVAGLAPQGDAVGIEAFDMVAQIDDLRGKGLTVAAACRAMGCSTTTYYRRRRAAPPARIVPPAPLLAIPDAFAQAREWRAFAVAELDDAAVWRLDPAARVAKARLYAPSAPQLLAQRPRLRFQRGALWRAACAVTPLRWAMGAVERMATNAGWRSPPRAGSGLNALMAGVGLAAALATASMLMMSAASNPLAWSLAPAPTTAALAALPQAGEPATLGR